MEQFGFNLILVASNTYGFPPFSREGVALDNPGDINSPQMGFWKDLYKYCIDRWGVYTDIFELFNESRPSDEFYKVIVPWLRSINPYNLLISTSYHPYNDNLDTLFDLKSHHPYQQASAKTLDNTIWGKYNSDILGSPALTPTYWGETGNLAPFSNYHPNRFRVMTWMLFMTCQAPVYWNNSFAMFDTGSGGIRNQYIGPEERAFNRIFTDITKDFPANHSIARLTTSQPTKVRAYALTAPNDLLVYFYYYADRPATLTGLQNDTGPVLSGVTANITVPTGADMAVWIDPATANIDQTLSVTPGSRTFTVPDIMIDKVLRIGSSTATVSNTSGAPDVLDMGLNCYPNPFNTGVDINFPLKIQDFNGKNVEVKIYDITGKLLKSKVNLVHSSSGTKARWKAANQPAGIYIIKVKAGTHVLHKKVTLVK
jgi:hypothetical protein